MIKSNNTLRQQTGLFLAALSVAFVLPFWAGAVHAEDFVIYLKPGGNDRMDGLTKSKAVGSLQAAVDRALARTDPKFDRLMVRVLPGQYKGQHVVTKGPPSGKALIIGPESGKERPRFDGAGKGGTWLTLKNSSGKPTKIKIEGLEISNYVTAISLNGDRTNPGASNSDNEIRNNVFNNIGQIAYPSGTGSTAAIRLVNSRENRITENRFKNIRNITGCGALHSIYIAHYSTHNLISDNTFDGGCGATIKVRDASNYNSIRRNKFIAQETKSTFLDGYCNHDERSDCTKPTAECPSWENLYEENYVEMKGASPVLKAVQIKSGKIPAGCTQPSPGSIRVRETGTRIIP